MLCWRSAGQPQKLQTHGYSYIPVLLLLVKPPGRSKRPLSLTAVFQEGLTAGVNWRISGYRNDVSDLIDYDDHTLKYYNEGKARICFRLFNHRHHLQTRVL